MERLHKAYGHGVSLDDFKARIEADSEAIRKRDAVTKYDEEGELGVSRASRGPWSVVK